MSTFWLFLKVQKIFILLFLKVYYRNIFKMYILDKSESTENLFSSCFYLKIWTANKNMHSVLQNIKISIKCTNSWSLSLQNVWIEEYFRSIVQVYFWKIRESDRSQNKILYFCCCFLRVVKNNHSISWISPVIFQVFYFFLI